MDAYGVCDHDCKDCARLLDVYFDKIRERRGQRTWLVGIVAVEFGYQPRHDHHLDKEYYGMKQRLTIVKACQYSFKSVTLLMTS